MNKGRKSGFLFMFRFGFSVVKRSARRVKEFNGLSFCRKIKMWSSGVLVPVYFLVHLLKFVQAAT